MLESIEFLESGFVQSYIDFFYITTRTTPNIVEALDHLNEDDLEDRDKEPKVFEMTEQNLVDLKKTLISAEENTRYNDSFFPIGPFSQGTLIKPPRWRITMDWQRNLRISGIIK